MNFKLRLLALLLAMLMVLSSCSLSIDSILEYLPSDWFSTEPQPTEPQPTEPQPTEPECTDHVDADGDEKCDVCGAAVPAPECTDHIDADGDEKCDNCGADVPAPECTDHIDSDRDEKCDKCGADVPKQVCDTHKDANVDYTCDVCGEPCEPTTAEIIAAWKRADHSMTRAEVLALYTLTDEEFEAALAVLDQMVEVSKTAESAEAIDVYYDQFEKAYYHLAEQRTIASIVYYCNMSDEPSAERHLDAQAKFLDLHDKYMQSLRTIYLESPHKDELFADWSEDEIRELLEYDPVIIALNKEIEELQVQFDNLDQNSYSFNTESVEIYKQIILKNNQLARLNGYDNYYEYASKNVYGRDYDTEDLAMFRQYIVDYVVPNFSKVYGDFMEYRNLSSTRQTTFSEFLNKSFDKTKKNYLLKYLYSLEGKMGESMLDVFENKNCVFSNNTSSHPTAFQTYLYESDKPFCLFGSKGQSANTIVHEIGHYYEAIANGDVKSYDLLETHSQGNEFLFTNFLKDEMNSAVYSCVRAYNLVNACYVIIIATLVDEFEQRVYALDDETIANMTSDDFDAIMADVCEPYGGVSWVSQNLADPMSYWRRVAISNPVYYISYAVSAVAAVEIFALAESDTAAAFEAYRILVEDARAEDGFIGALKKAGLYTPFEEEAFRGVAVVLSK